MRKLYCVRLTKQSLLSAFSTVANVLILVPCQVRMLIALYLPQVSQNLKKF